MTDFADKQNEKINQYIVTIATATDAAKQSEAFQEWVKFNGLFWNYSFGNQILIAMQKPYGTRAMALSKWEAIGGKKKDGATPAYILAPIIVTDKETGEKVFINRYRGTVTYVKEDIDGDFPEIDWKHTERKPEVEAKLIAFAQSKGINVAREHIYSGALGYSMGGSIVLTPDAGLNVLIHELAHELTKSEKDTETKANRELEAEVTAFVVASFFGVADMLKSANYLAMYVGNTEEIKKRMTKISNLAKTIIAAVVE